MDDARDFADRAADRNAAGIDDRELDAARPAGRRPAVGHPDFEEARRAVVRLDAPVEIDDLARFLELHRRMTARKTAVARGQHDRERRAHDIVAPFDDRVDRGLQLGGAVVRSADHPVAEIDDDRQMRNAPPARDIVGAQQDVLDRVERVGVEIGARRIGRGHRRKLDTDDRPRVAAEGGIVAGGEIHHVGPVRRQLATPPPCVPGGGNRRDKRGDRLRPRRRRRHACIPAGYRCPCREADRACSARCRKESAEAHRRRQIQVDRPRPAARRIRPASLSHAEALVGEAKPVVNDTDNNRAVIRGAVHRPASPSSFAVRQQLVAQRQAQRHADHRREKPVVALELLEEPARDQRGAHNSRATLHCWFGVEGRHAHARAPAPALIRGVEEIVAGGEACRKCP